MKRAVAVTLIGWVLAFGPGMEPASAADVPTVDIEEVLAEMGQWDGQRVAVVGELVGDYSRRSDGVWLQINDDAYVTAPIGRGGLPTASNTGIGARVPEAVFDAADTGAPGRNGRTGPVVKAVGVFHHNDPDLGGETFLEIDQMTVLRPAVAYPAEGPDAWLWIGIGLVVLAGAVSFMTRRRRTTGVPSD